MTGAGNCGDLRQALGGYLLGAIDPAERAIVDAHLAGCPACREELAGLAGLPALLRRVPSSEVERLAAGPGGGDTAAQGPGDRVLRSLLAQVARSRRARRWRAGTAAAAVIVAALGTGAAGTAVVHALTAGARPATAAVDSWRTVSGGGTRSAANVTVRYAATEWGTTMAVRVTGIAPGTLCQFQIVDSAGHVRVLGRWRVNYRSGSTWYPVSTSVASAGLRSFQVTTGGRVVASVAAH